MLRQFVKNTPALDAILTAIRRRELERSYVDLREARSSAYRELKSASPYDENEVASKTKTRMASRGLQPVSANKQHVRTLSFIPQFGWHKHLIESLAELGPVENFDSSSFGNLMALVPSIADKEAVALIEKVGDSFVEFAVQKHREKPFDWMFYYAQGSELLAKSINAIQDKLGIPVVGMCLDDKHCYDLPGCSAQRGGISGLVKATTLSMTSARVACEWYMADAGNPIFLPEGYNPKFFKPNWRLMDTGPDIVFVGSLYGYRRQFVRRLEAMGFNVEVFGFGTKGGAVSDARYLELCQSAKVFLGIAGIGYSDTLKNIKGRDFEVLGAGGCYLTTFEPDLSTWFTHRREISFYSTEFELIENLRELLSNKRLRQSMREQAVAASEARHTWPLRFRYLLSHLSE